MQISIKKSEISGHAQAPPSKSYTIRGLMCAALSKGTSSLENPLYSDDIEAALSVLRKIGVRIETRDDLWTVSRSQLVSPSEDLFCRESAATLRFMTAVCSLVSGICRLTAGPTLSRRPIKPLVDALKKWGVEVSSHGEFAPVVVNGGTLCGGLTELPGDISSQFVSALLMVAPLAIQETSIRVITPLESRPYVLMTIECLQQFGIRIEHSDDLACYIVSPQSYRPAQYQVEGDWSSASYLLALGAAAGKVQVRALSLSSLQADRVILGMLKEMGADISTTGDSIAVGKKGLKAIRVDLNECIDLLPTMAVLAALAEGVSEFTGIERARLKESNRISSVKQGLERSGIRVIEEKNSMMITGGKPQKALIDSQNDHRIAMAFSILGAAAGGITIDGAECVSKTYPEYWNIIRRLGAKLDEQ